MVVASDNFMYLGAPICSKRPTGHWFSHCLNQTNSLLTWWNQKQLTMARTPDNNQISPGSDFLILNSTIKTFQWGGTNSLHLLAWDRECRPYNLGRLNIRSCAEFQAALLCKQVFKLFADQQNLWVISIINKYDSTFTTPIWTASPTWKMLCKLIPTIRAYITWQIGPGSQIRLWLDPWLWKKPMVWYPLVPFNRKLWGHHPFDSWPLDQSYKGMEYYPTQRHFSAQMIIKIRWISLNHLWISHHGRCLQHRA